MSETKGRVRRPLGGMPPAVASADLANAVPLLQRYATRTGLNLPHGLDLETWLALGAELARAETVLTWAVGDWWAFGQHRYGDRAAIVRDPGWQGPVFEVCMNYAAVARKFETSRRREALSFKHHAEVAGLDAAVADRWLDWCEDPLRQGEPRPHSTSMLRERVRDVREEQDRRYRGETRVGETQLIAEEAREIPLHVPKSDHTTTPAPVTSAHRDATAKPLPGNGQHGDPSEPSMPSAAMALRAALAACSIHDGSEVVVDWLHDCGLGTAIWVFRHWHELLPPEDQSEVRAIVQDLLVPPIRKPPR